MLQVASHLSFANFFSFVGAWCLCIAYTCRKTLCKKISSALSRLSKKVSSRQNSQDEYRPKITKRFTRTGRYKPYDTKTRPGGPGCGPGSAACCRSGCCTIRPAAERTTGVLTCNRCGAASQWTVSPSRPLRTGSAAAAAAIAAARKR